MKTSAIILAGGFSKRFGHDKGLVDLAGKPLVLHVLDRIAKVANETLIVVSSAGQKDVFMSFIKAPIKVLIDQHSQRSPIVGALTGFKHASGEYSLLLPCDTPFVSKKVASLLLDLCVNKGAVIPRWPNRYIEPLQAAYHTESALNASETAYKGKRLAMRFMVDNLSGVRYVSTLVLQQIDPRLMTFFNVNTTEDLKKAESMLKRLNTYSFSLPR
ncbi:MAG: molybdenum cofactor guanylyltransferase [Candidatus Bathyarchaeota archaeon]|nr:molybdenum cofactor guanylyltransferase [Candidatus Bathyarchaeota archaeon]MDH5732440.1 molybdenum cofactor guanylyltransferase [Candidatus Bathyarchaeota archaeon]